MEHIALLLPDLRGGGAERVVLLLAREFLRQGRTVDLVVLHRRGELVGMVPEGATVVDLGTDRYRSAVRPIVSYLRRRRPDALLASMWPLTVVALAAGKIARSGARLVVVDHNTLSAGYAGKGALHRVMLRFSLASYRAATARIAVSSGVADDLAQLSRIPRSSFKVIHNPVELRDEAIAAARNPGWSVPPGRRILSVGSLKRQKNHELLIRAFARMPGAEEAQLMILGEGPLRHTLLATARAEGVADRVLMPGFAQDPSRHYRSADLFVLSSDYEGFANVLVEALACGLPVVSTDCPSGPAEILEDGRYGRLVPVGGVDALANAMADALAARHDRTALRKRAAAFSPPIAASRYLDLLPT